MKDIQQNLELLYDLLVDNFSTLKGELIGLIAQPQRIGNTNKFASLLSELRNPIFINPLLLQISLSSEADTWLRDFLYALVNLLDESSVNDEFEIPENLIEKLEIWILQHSGELAWKAAALLKFYDSKEAERIQLQKLQMRDDFFLTYVECLLGLLRYDKKKHLPLVASIAVDETRDDKLRAFAANILKKQP